MHVRFHDILTTPIVIQRFASEKEGDREVQRTMLELLNQLDGFSSHSDIKVPQPFPPHPPASMFFLFIQVIAATNRVDTLDPALLRSGQLVIDVCQVYSLLHPRSLLPLWSRSSGS